MSKAGLRPPLQPVLEVRELRKSYPLPGKDGQRLYALQRLNLRVEVGEICALVGESGSGKSSAARSILQLTPPDSGQVLLAGQMIFDSSEGGMQLRGRAWRTLRREMQPIFQHPELALNPRANVWQTVYQPLAYHGFYPQKEQQLQVRQLLDECGLSAAWDGSYPHQLSGGQRQRLALARALALQPRLLVADEPFASLDASGQAQMVQLLQKLRQLHHLSVLWISHNLPLVFYLSDRVAVLFSGLLVEYGPTEAVFTQPLHPYTQALLTRQERLTLRRGGEGGCPYYRYCSLADPQCARQLPPEKNGPLGRRLACHATEANFPKLPLDKK